MKRRTIWTTIASLIVAWIFVYIVFIIDKGFSPGNELTKSDWLSFLGDYLGLIGTILLGIIALRQNQIFKDENDKSQKQINQINSELMKMQMASMMPFIDARFEDILKPLTQEDKKRQGIPEHEFRNAFMVETKSVDYVLIWDSGEIDARLGMMAFDPDFHLLKGDETHLDFRLRKIVLTNMGNSAALDIKVNLNGETVLRTFNLAANTSFCYFLLSSKKLNTIDCNFDIKYTILNGGKYVQSFRYAYSLPDTLGNIAASYKFEDTKFPQKLESPDNK